MDIDADDLNAVDDAGDADDRAEVGQMVIRVMTELANKTRQKAAATEDPARGLSIEAKARNGNGFARQMEDLCAEAQGSGSGRQCGRDPPRTA